MTNFAILNTVSVVQLVERQIVVLVVVGSSPTVHPPLRSCIARSLFFIYCLCDRGELVLKVSRLWDNRSTFPVAPIAGKAVRHGRSCNSPDSGGPATDTCRPGVTCRSPSFGVT